MIGEPSLVELVRGNVAQLAAEYGHELILADDLTLVDVERTAEVLRGGLAGADRERDLGVTEDLGSLCTRCAEWREDRNRKVADGFEHR